MVLVNITSETFCDLLLRKDRKDGVIMNPIRFIGLKQRGDKPIWDEVLEVGKKK